MPKKTLFNLLITLFIILPVSAMAAGMTAKSMLPKATGEAIKWQPDAVLVNINTDANPDGTGDLWAFTFLSPKTGQKMLIMVDSNGEVSTYDSSYFQNHIIGDFSVDSDKAMAEAIKNGLKTSKFGMKMNLESNGKNAEWRMLDDKNFYYIDANSGKLLRKEKAD
jgi:hypothetical protein